MFNYISPGATLVACVGLAILIIWNVWLSKLHKVFQIVQGPLVAVAVGIIYYIMTKDNSTWSIDQSMLVSVPTPEDLSSFLGQFSSPNFDQITNPQIWVTAFTIALVASLETLLCVEATDKLDPKKRITLPNRELKAQGVGNIISGFIGGFFPDSISLILVFALFIILLRTFLLLSIPLSIMDCILSIAIFKDLINVSSSEIQIEAFAFISAVQSVKVKA